MCCYLKSNETFPHLFGAWKTKVLRWCYITQVISARSACQACADASCNMIISHSNISRKRPGNKERMTRLFFMEPDILSYPVSPDMSAHSFYYYLDTSLICNFCKFNILFYLCNLCFIPSIMYASASHGIAKRKHNIMLPEYFQDLLKIRNERIFTIIKHHICLLYTSDAADDLLCVD